MRIFLGGLPDLVRGEDVESWLSEEGFGFQFVRLITDPGGCSKNCCIVAVNSEEEGLRIVQRYDQAPCNGCVLVCRPARPNPRQDERAARTRKKKGKMTEKKDLRSPTVRVANIPVSVEDHDFERWLSSMGVSFTQLIIIRDRDERSAGYGFVVSETHEQAALAVQRIDGARLRARVLSASVGQHRPLRSRRVA